MARESHEKVAAAGTRRTRPLAGAPPRHRMRPKSVRPAIIMALLCSPLALSAGAARASSLLYTPVNPVFGGYPANGPYEMQVAQAINTYHPAATAATTVDPGAQFIQQLQGQLLGALSTQITNLIFGTNAAPSGQIVYGNESIAFARTLGAVNLTITNTDTGAITQIVIPTVVASTTGH